MKKNLLNGEKVRQILDERRLTIQDLADACGSTRSILSQWINGRRNPRRPAIQSIADALKVNISEISECHDDDIIEPVSIPVPSGSSAERNAVVFQTILDELRYTVQKNGLVQTSKRIGISHPQISKLLNGDAKIELFPVVALLNLFPDAEINFKRSASVSESVASATAKSRLTELLPQMTEEEAVQVMTYISAFIPRLSSK